MKKNFIHTLAASVMLVATAGLMCACTANDDNPVDNPPVVDNGIKTGAIDVVHGEIIHYINIDRLQDYKLPVAALKDVVVEPEDNEYFDLSVEEIDGERYIVPYQKKAPKEDLTVKRVKIYPKGMPERARNVFFVYGNPKKAQTRAANEIEIAYSQTLGMGTNIYGEVGNIVSNGEPVLFYDSIMDLGQAMYTGKTLQRVDYQESEGQDYQKTVDTYAWSVGVNITSSKLGSKLSNKLFNKSLQQKPNATLNIQANLGHSGSETDIKNREYYMKTCLAKKYYISLNVNTIFDPQYNISEELAKYNLGLLGKTLNKKFTKTLAGCDSAEFNCFSFYKAWGTDVITQGVYGGYLQYTYSRMESCYETTSKWDASASLTYSEPKSNLKGIVGAASVLTGKTAQEQYSAQFDGSWSNEDYQSITKANSYIYIVGGNLTASSGGNLDVNQWLTGINDSNANLALISYRNPDSGDYNSEESCLLQIEMVIDGFIRNLEKALGENIEEDDKQIIKRLTENGQKLYNSRYDYIANHAVFQQESDPLVIADFIVMRYDDSRPGEEPKSFVGTDIRGKKHIYYPMMNNDFSPNTSGSNQHSYTLDATTEDYAHCSNGDWDLYFWYALEPASECDGFTDITFGNYYNFKDEGYYRLTSEHNHSKVSDDEDEYPDGEKRAIFGKYASKDTPNSLKIKAIAIVGDYPENKFEVLHEWIYSSTGGSELHYNYTGSELDDFKNYWATDFSMYAIDKPTTFHPQGSYEDYTCGVPIHLLLSKKTLNLTSVKDICHPKLWNGTERSSSSREGLDAWIDN